MPALGCRGTACRARDWHVTVERGGHDMSCPYTSDNTPQFGSDPNFAPYYSDPTPIPHGEADPGLPQCAVPRIAASGRLPGPGVQAVIRYDCQYSG